MFARIRNPVCFILILTFAYSFASPNIIKAPKTSADLEVKEDLQSQEVREVKLTKETQLATVKYGEHLKLICDVELSSGIEVEWYMQGKELGRSSSPELDINTADTTYKGQYITCNAILPNNTVADTRGISIAIDLGEPLKDDPITNTTVIAGNNVTLSCNNNGSALPPPINWHLKKSNATFEDLGKTGDVLVITNATLSDAGEYKCNYSANCNCESYKTFVVTVHMVPTVEIEQTNLTYSYGEDVEISCKVDGYPLPKVIWKDNKGNQAVAKSTIENAHIKISVLKLNKIKVSSNYTCHAENELGQAETSINITVNSPFTVHNIPNNEIYVGNGKSEDIVCNITAPIPMEILWFYQNSNSSNASDIHKIDNDDDYSISSDFTTLQIKSMKLDLARKYKCDARLIADKDETKDFSFDVKFGEPVAPKITSKKLILLENSSAILFCKIEGGTPVPTLSWHFWPIGESTKVDLNVTSEEYQLNNVGTSDSGVYQCIARNPSGVVESSTDVLVRPAE